MPRRTTADATADRTKVIDLAARLREDIAGLQIAISALPAPAARTTGQQRDALVMRCLIRLVRFALISSSAGTAADRTNEPT